jgi:thiamine-phosphate pyrophosphorylase
MKLIVITPSSTIEDEHYILGQMLDMGLPSLHIRKLKLTKKELRTYLDGFTQSQQKKIILHKHYGLLWDFDLKGIHISKRQRGKKARFFWNRIVLRMRRGNFLMGASCESFSSLSVIYKRFDYIMISPVFTGLNGHVPAMSTDTLKKLLPSYPGKVIARGGTTPENIDTANRLGFSGIAFQEYLWENPEPLVSFQKILDTFREQGITIE